MKKRESSHRSVEVSTLVKILDAAKAVTHSEDKVVSAIGWLIANEVEALLESTKRA